MIFYDIILIALAFCIVLVNCKLDRLGEILVKYFEAERERLQKEDKVR